MKNPHSLLFENAGFLRLPRISHTPGKLQRRLPDIFGRILNSVIGQSSHISAGADRRDNIASIVVNGSADTPVSNLEFLIVHCPTLFPDFQKLLMEFVNTPDRIWCKSDKTTVLHPVFQFRETGTGAGGQVEGILEKVGELENRDKLRAAGYTL